MKKKGVRKKETKKSNKDIKKKSSSPTVKRSPRINSAEVIESYKELQDLFQKVYENEKVLGNNDNLAKLDKFKEIIFSKVEAYKKDHRKLNELANEIPKGLKLVNSIESNLAVPKSLKEEVSKIEGKNVNKNEKIRGKDIIKGNYAATKVKVNKEKTEGESGKPEMVLQPPKKLKPKGKLIEKYFIEIDGAKVDVEIRKEDLRDTYTVFIPEVSIATTTLLNELRNELISVTSISLKELTDPKAFSGIKERFREDAIRIIRQKLPHIEAETETFLIGTLIQDMLGLGKIEFLVNDPRLEEIVITSSKENIRVYSKKYGWLETNIRIEKEEDIVNYANIIARRVGRQINVLSPLLDAHLVSGDRVNAVLYPINTKGNTITIRKFARDPYTIVDLINNKTCDEDTASLLWLAIEYEMNILISGGTAAGKTSFLNACMPFIPPNHRIISIEDTRELMLPEFLYWTPLVTRSPNPEGKGEVNMLNLLVNSLRMRPDRIILGEMRKHDEAMVLFEAMHTGHSVYATVHADSAAETISRLVNPPLNVPPNLLNSVNLNVIMFRDRRKGIRKIFQIAEFIADEEDAKYNIIYRWSPERDEIVKHNESSKFFGDLGRHTGMSQIDIKNVLKEKKKILQWLIKRKIRGLEDLGKVFNLYYKNKSDLLKAISRNNIKHILRDEQ